MPETNIAQRPLQVVLPYAGSSAPACRAALPGLELPELDRLLRRLRPEPASAPDPYGFCPPHEQALALAWGLPAGLDERAATPPWAALQAWQTLGPASAKQAWAWVSPCHWQVGSHQITLLDPEALGLSGQESQELRQLLAPLFAGDGLELHALEPQRWLASGELLRGLRSASLDRVVGRAIDPWMPNTDAARPLRRLQAETQMLLYTHGFSEARAARGQLACNAFWLSGSGALPAGWQPPDTAPRCLDSLRTPALRDDGPAWAAAWQQLDATVIAELRRDVQNGAPLQLTLCGEQSRQCWRSGPRSLKQTLSGLWQGSRLRQALDLL